MKFLEKAQSNQHTTPLGDEACKLYVMLTMAEMKGKDVPLDDELKSHGTKILEKRIEVLKLPIEFTNNAKIAIDCFTLGNPGKTVALLIDCLTKYEGQKVSVSMLSDVYPFGFYNEETFEDYVDNYLKTNKAKWSEIY